ncbi:hypothetical protein V8B97DRAFT_841644 [Scleroderma yunnanense]
MKKPRNGLSSCTSLHRVQQLTHPAIICRFLTIALARVMTFTQKGRNCYTQGQYQLAQIFFIGSAELAAALMTLSAHTEGLSTRYLKRIGDCIGKRRRNRSDIWKQRVSGLV